MGRFNQQRLDALYEQQMGFEAAERQRKLKTKAKGGCACQTRKIKKRWDGIMLSERTIHEEGCPKFKWWMAEVDKL